MYYYSETDPENSQEGNTALNVKLLYRINHWETENGGFTVRTHKVALKRNIWDKLQLTKSGSDVYKKCQFTDLETYEIWHTKPNPRYEECLTKYFHETDYRLTGQYGDNTFDTVATSERRARFAFGFPISQKQASAWFFPFAPSPAIAADQSGLLDPSKYVALHSQIYTYHLNLGWGNGHCTAISIDKKSNARQVEVRIVNFNPKTQESHSDAWLLNIKDH